MTAPDFRPGTRFATYPGDASGILGQIFGPTLLRERWTAVEAEHNPRLGVTTVGFALTTTHDVDEHFARINAEAAVRAEHPAIFGERG